MPLFARVSKSVIIAIPVFVTFLARAGFAAGASAAFYLLVAGHDVTIFEKDPEPGGMLRYGIPQYRLPKIEVLDGEYQSITRLGGRFECGKMLGRDFTVADLKAQGYDGVVVAIGCYDTNDLGIPGEDADGVIDGLDYLHTAALGLTYPDHEGSRVVVVGGGYTSMDCSRTSVRQGAKEVTLVYRRDMKDMPAADEVHEMIEEGARAIFQAGPTRVVTDANNKVIGLEFIRMQLGAPDASGRRRPEPAPGTEFIIECDRILKVITLLPRDANLLAVNGALHLQLRLFEQLDDLLAALLIDAVAQRNILPRFSQIRQRIFQVDTRNIDASFSELQLENVQHLLELEFNLCLHLHYEFFFLEFVLTSGVFEVEAL